MARLVFGLMQSLDGYVAAASGELVIPPPDAVTFAHFTERTRAAVTEQALQAEQAALDRLLDEAARHRLAARTAGQLILQRAGDLQGRFLRNGDIVGYIDPGGRRIGRARIAGQCPRVFSQKTHSDRGRRE